MGMKIREVLYVAAKYGITITIINIMKIFWLIPIREDTIIFLSFNGKQYSDSPKYICEYIETHCKTKQLIWAFIKPELHSELNGRYKIVKVNSFRYLISILTAKVIITNNFISSYIPIRKRQILLNTWHGGSPLKTVGLKDEGKTLYDEMYFKIQDRKYTAFISSSHFATEGIIKESFNYNGEILEYGMPRNAILFNSIEEKQKQKDKVYHYYHIEKSESIILYAPTFRGSTDKAFFLSEEEQFDIGNCVEALEKKTGKKYVFLFRSHHTMDIKLKGNYILATDYPDMQELLCASDVLITDYSSCMGDMALMNKAVFLYIPDVELYTKEKGFYWDICSLPFPIAKSDRQLVENIRNFDSEQYDIGIMKYHEKLGSFEGPDSTKKVYEWLMTKW